MRKIRLFSAVLCLTLLLALGLGARSHAQGVNDFVINNFDSNQTLTSDDPQGLLHIVETIDLTFSAYNHGILRAIPNDYKGHRLLLKVNSITSSSGAPTKYTTYGDSGNTVLKIGDASRTITGKQNYKIDYSLTNVITFYDDHDELYWDVNGDQWQQPFEQVNYTLTIGQNIKPNPSYNIDCFTGSFGDTAKNCQANRVTLGNGQSQYTVKTTQPLTARQTLTVVVGFQKGVFKPYTWFDRAMEYKQEILGFIIMPILVIPLAFSEWWRKGRDPKGRGVIIAQYGPPKGLDVLEVGAIGDFSVDNKDMTAAIIDLAVRRYIKIIETKQKKLGRDKTVYTLQLTNADLSQLNERETKLINGLFTTVEQGTTVDLGSLKNKFYKTAADLRKTVSETLTTEGYFANNPLKRGGKGKILAGVGLVAAFFLMGVLGKGFLFGAILAFAVSFIFGAAMPARTAKGVETNEEIEGLKLYLNVAEKDRIKMLQSPDARYAAPTGPEPARTVDLFEKLLPYAILLGVEKGWSKQFESIYIEQPDWYSGNWNTFNAVYLASSLNDGFGSAMATNFSSPSSSGSSGFGGGGFSGGGGGGGGGGGW